MERQDLVENILRLYVWVIDQKSNYASDAMKLSHKNSRIMAVGRMQAYRTMKARIEELFTPSV